MAFTIKMAAPAVVYVGKSYLSSTVVFCFAVLLVHSSVRADDVCTNIKGDSNQKEVPDLDVDIYMVESRTLLVNESSAILGLECYDGTRSVMNVRVFHEGLESGLMVDFSNNSFVKYDMVDKQSLSYNCKIEYVDNADGVDLQMLGILPLSEDSEILSLPELISIFRKSDYAYIGQEDIKGLPVDHWQSCQNWNDFVFLMDIYFTTEDFQPVDSKTPKQVPVRITQTTDTIYHIHDYFNFQVRAELPTETYSLPNFVECKGRTDTVWTKKIPTLPESMSYTVEKVVSSADQTKFTVDVQTVYHDVKRGLVRVDSDKTTSISDFSTGIEFLIDGNGCTQRPIDPQNVPSAYKDGDIIKMGDAPEIAYLRKYDYYYSGTRQYRGIWTEGFSRDTATEQIEAFFATEEQTPLGVGVRQLATNKQIVYNIFNFVSFSYHPDTHPFDPRGCDATPTKAGDWKNAMREDRRIRLVFTNTYRDSSDILPYMDQISEQLRDRIASELDVSVLQIVPYDYMAMEKNIYWYVSLMGFDTTKERAKVQEPKQLKAASTISSLLFSAIYEGRIHFTFVSDDSRQNLDIWASSATRNSQMFTSSGNSDILTSFNSYEHKCSDSFDSFQTTQVQSLMDCAQQCEDLACRSIQYREKTRSCELTYERVSDWTDDSGCNLYVKSYASGFIGGRQKILVREADASYDTETRDDCAKLCVEEKKYDCKSFDFCKDEKKCSLHSVSSYGDEAVVNKESSTENTFNCDQWTRSPLNDFTMQGKLDVSSSQVVELTAPYSDCAYACNAYGGEGCSMFAYCRAEPGGSPREQCKLVPKSAEKTVTTTTSKRCYFYSRKGVTGSSGGGFERQQQQGGTTYTSGYTGGVLFVLAIAMVTSGIGIAVLTVFLLSWFNVWKGFQ